MPNSVGKRHLDGEQKILRMIRLADSSDRCGVCGSTGIGKKLRVTTFAETGKGPRQDKSCNAQNPSTKHIANNS